MNFARSLDAPRTGRGAGRPHDPLRARDGRTGAADAGTVAGARRAAARCWRRHSSEPTWNERVEKLAGTQAGNAPPNCTRKTSSAASASTSGTGTPASGVRCCGARRSTVGSGDGAVKLTVKPARRKASFAWRATKSPDPATNPDLVYLHEVLMAWTGWSLGAPQPGRAIDTERPAGREPDRAELPPGMRFSSRVRGARHRCRGCATAAATGCAPAWSISPATRSTPSRTTSAPRRPKHAEPYLRYDPVAAPAVALVKRAAAATSSRRPRASRCSASPSEASTSCPRTTCVPSTEGRGDSPFRRAANAREAEQHGELDAGGKVDAGTFDLLANSRTSRASRSALADDRARSQGRSTSAG